MTSNLTSGIYTDASGYIIVTACAVLVVFGVLYNMLTAWLQEHGHADGETSLLVVGGVLVTELVVAVTGVQPWYIHLTAFACSGIPMVLGSKVRHAMKRRDMTKRIEALIND